MEKISTKAFEIGEELVQMKEADLVYITDLAISLRRRIRDGKNEHALLALRPGQIVSFEDRKTKYVGKITKLNRKRVSVSTLGEKPIHAQNFIKHQWPVEYLVPARMLTVLEEMPKLHKDPFANVPHIESVRMGKGAKANFSLEKAKERADEV